jgi:ribosomal protein L40E
VKAIIVKKAICEQCGGPRHGHGAKLCRKCYVLNAKAKKRRSADAVKLANSWMGNKGKK